MTQQDTCDDADIEREEEQSLLSHDDAQTTLSHKSQGLCFPQLRIGTIGAYF